MSVLVARFWQTVFHCVFFVGAIAATATAEPPIPQQAEQFAVLEKSLSGATLVGHFTDSNDAATSLQSERYELKSVQHIGKGQWLFQAKISYGNHEVTLPLTLPIYWAGDTPVITVDKLPFPGLGTYTARVMIFADHYAGFWSGADHGGHLFGVIERKPAKTSQEEAAEERGESNR